MLAFPDAYTIGISHLGSQVLYHRLNDLDFCAADRAYCPTADAVAVMRETELPLFGWESRESIADADFIGFSLGYELCVTNVLTMLDLAGVPLRSCDRQAGHPLIVGGDALADTPEPIAPFFDVLIPGDGEEPVVALAELLRETKPLSLSRDDLLRRIAETIPSAYVPSLYGDDETPPPVARAVLRDLSDSPALSAPLVPLAEGVHDRAIIEVMRGCPNACRFCQAGYTRLPVRKRSIDEILAAARASIDATGYHELSLLSLSTGDYGDLEGLLDALHTEFGDEKVNISLPSLRVDEQLKILPKLTSQVRKSGLTIAAEAGSERLRMAIRKGITEQDMLAGVAAAYEAGYSKVKVYFMAGLPGETDDDLDAIISLCRKLSWTAKPITGHPGSITASVSWYVPKPHTPMQWFGMARAEDFWHVRERLIEGAARSPINVKFHRIEQSLLEALLCRGQRDVADTIEAAYRAGAFMDSWNEHWNWELWEQAIAETGVDFDAVVHADRTPGDRLPWSHITCQLDETHLAKQRQHYLDALNDHAS